MPSVTQMKMMIQKLLADRFQLTFHRDKKELSVYAITVGKTGAKLTKSESDPNGLRLFFAGTRGLPCSERDHGGIRQRDAGHVLDRPVVDQTGFGRQSTTSR